MASTCLASSQLPKIQVAFHVASLCTMTRSNKINICVSGQTWFRHIGFVSAVSFSVCIGVNVHTGVDVRSGQG